MDYKNLETSQQKIRLDFCQHIYNIVLAKQYDKQSRFVPITCTDNGQPFPLNPDYLVQVKMYTPDKRAILNTVPIQSDGSLLLELTETMLAYPGKAEAEIRIYTKDAKKLLTTMSFFVMIEPSVYGEDQIIASNEFNALLELMEKALADYTYVITQARASAEAAANSATIADQKATESANSAAESLQSANKSEEEAIKSKNSADAAKVSETNAKNSENAAESYKIDAENSSISSANSAASALQSEKIATTKANEASDSAKNAKDYMDAAKESELAAAASASVSSEKADESSASAESALQSANTATQKANEASQSEESSRESAKSALNYATSAENSASDAEVFATEAESFAHGGTGTRTGEDTDNAMAYAQKAKDYADEWKGSLLPQGTITFSQLPTSQNVAGHMYTISEAFVTDSRFEEGSDYSYPAGTCVFWTEEGKWKCISGVLTRELTQAEYDALTEVEKKNGTIYYISDADNTIPNANENLAGLMSPEDKKKLDGIDTNANNYSLPVASSTERGGVKVGYSQNGRNYPVQLSDEKMYVNVPWTDTQTTATSVKGNNETTYRTGQVNLTAENIGALPTSGGTVSSLTVTDQAILDDGIISNLTVTGQTTLEGNVRIKPSGKNYGSIINIGDGTYIQISEDTDDTLTVKAKQININSTNENSVYINGQKAVVMQTVTQSQYNALTTDQKNNGTLYFITDAT